MKSAPKETPVSADLLHRAATFLRDPYLCNWETAVALALADLLERIYVMPQLVVMPSIREFAEAVARAVLREPDLGGEAAREAPPKAPNDLVVEPGPVPKGGE